MRRIIIGLALAFIIVSPCISQHNIRPTHTYSIVAFDKETGQLGVAVQSHWFSVGPIVPWIESGVGAIATQSFVEVSYGPLGLELMKAGKSPVQALAALMEADENEDVRQVAMVDAMGRVAAHTGKNCIPEAGHFLGEHFSCQANLMLKNTVDRLLVVEVDGTQRTPVGILSTTDLIKEMRGIRWFWHMG